jgi:uncharacterized membrane protein (UPF0127 family)
MKIAERIVMVLLLLCLLGGAGWIYYAVQQEQQAVRDAVARGEYEISIATSTEIVEDDWRVLYPNTVPIRIGEVVVEASVADTLSERIQGLSGTPFLPNDVVKLFVFGVAGKHSIWMKDMQYPIDIIWITEAGEIVAIEENVSPDSYPGSFTPKAEAWYVIEANAGFAASNTIAVGDKVTLK